MSKEPMKLALEALESCGEGHITDGGYQWHDAKLVDTAITSICQAIAELESQEPVAWRTFDGEGQYEYRAYEDNEDYGLWWEERHPNHKNWVEPLYTHPPQRTVLQLKEIDRPESASVGFYNRGWNDCLFASGIVKQSQRTWVGLTDTEIDAIYTGVRAVHREIDSDVFARAIESKLKEINT